MTLRQITLFAALGCSTFAVGQTGLTNSSIWGQKVAYDGATVYNAGARINPITSAQEVRADFIAPGGVTGSSYVQTWPDPVVSGPSVTYDSIGDAYLTFEVARGVNPVYHMLTEQVTPAGRWSQVYDEQLTGQMTLVGNGMRTGWQLWYSYYGGAGKLGNTWTTALSVTASGGGAVFHQYNWGNVKGMNQVCNTNGFYMVAVYMTGTNPTSLRICSAEAVNSWAQNIWNNNGNQYFVWHPRLVNTKITTFSNGGVGQIKLACDTNGLYMGAQADYALQDFGAAIISVAYSTSSTMGGSQISGVFIGWPYPQPSSSYMGGLTDLVANGPFGSSTCLYASVSGTPNNACNLFQLTTPGLGATSSYSTNSLGTGSLAANLNTVRMLTIGSPTTLSSFTASLVPQWSTSAYMSSPVAHTVDSSTGSYVTGGVFNYIH